MGENKTKKSKTESIQKRRNKRIVPRGGRTVLKQWIILSIVVILSYIFVSCHHHPVEAINEPSVIIDDISCVEAWCRVQIPDEGLPAQVLVTKNEAYPQAFHITRSDTSFTIDSLQPSSGYDILLTILEANGRTKEIKRHIRTMDTTSHEITWESYSIGDMDLSYLVDVTITEDGRIVAVGDMKMKDSTGNRAAPYGLLQQDNGIWKPYQISMLDRCNNPNSPVFPATLDAVTYNDNKHILAVDSYRYTIWDFNEQSNLGCASVGIKRFHRAGKNDIYGAGANGIWHYDGVEWTKVPTGVGELQDITVVPWTGEIWACGWSNQGYSRVIRVNEKKVTTFWAAGETRPFYFINHDIITSLYLAGKEVYFGGSSGKMYRYSLFDTTQVRIETEKFAPNSWRLFNTEEFVFSVRGTGKNDIFLCCAYGLIWHFNGVRWKKITEYYDQARLCNLYAMAVTKNKIAIVGLRDSKAIVITGTR